MHLLLVLNLEQKVSSIEYDFKQHYDRESAPNGLSNGLAAIDGKEHTTAQVQLEV